MKTIFIDGQSYAFTYDGIDVIVKRDGVIIGEFSPRSHRITAYDKSDLRALKKARDFYKYS